MSAGRGVRDRVAAQSAMATVVALQHGAAPRGPLARTLGVTPLRPEARVPYQEALGELIVGDILDSLGPWWDVLHDVPLDGTTLDHLVIGPAGVHAVSVVHHDERDVVVDDSVVVVAGEPTDDLARAARRAASAAERLSDAAGEAVRVIPVLVVVRPRRLIERRRPVNVRVVAAHQLEQHLHRARRVATGDEVARWSDLADREQTWQTPSACATDVRELHRAFGRVRAEVTAAGLRRASWLGATVLAGSMAVWALVATAVSAVMAS